MWLSWLTTLESLGSLYGLTRLISDISYQTRVANETLVLLDASKWQLRDVLLIDTTTTDVPLFRSAADYSDSPYQVHLRLPLEAFRWNVFNGGKPRIAQRIAAIPQLKFYLRIGRLNQMSTQADSVKLLAETTDPRSEWLTITEGSYLVHRDRNRIVFDAIETHPEYDLFIHEVAEQQDGENSYTLTDSWDSYNHLEDWQDSVYSGRVHPVMVDHPLMCLPTEFMDTTEGPFNTQSGAEYGSVVAVEPGAVEPGDEGGMQKIQESLTVRKTVFLAHAQENVGATSLAKLRHSCANAAWLPSTLTVSALSDNFAQWLQSTLVGSR